MSDYYLDIETDSYRTQDGNNDFAKSPIIAITYQKMDSRTGKTKGEIHILKSWESTEENILRELLSVFNPFVLSQRWQFIPIGFNLAFDFISLLYRWRSIGVKVNSVSLFRHSHLDIQPIVTMFNHGMFKGATLENFAGKRGSGADIKELYSSKDYPAIEAYIEDETACFLNLYRFIAQSLPKLWEETHFLDGGNKNGGKGE